MLDTPFRPLGRLASVPTPHPVPPSSPGLPPMEPFDDDEPVNPEPAPPVQEPPGEGGVPTRLPGHPGQPAHLHPHQRAAHHEHAGA